jgi:hypothetical protein
MLPQSNAPLPHPISNRLFVHGFQLRHGLAILGRSRRVRLRHRASILYLIYGILEEAQELQSRIPSKVDGWICKA